MKRLFLLGFAFMMALSLSACSWFSEPVVETPFWTPELLSGYMQRESDTQMAYAGPFYFGNFDGVIPASRSYSEQRKEKVDEILQILDSGIGTLGKLDKKLKEEKEIFAWYVGEIKKIDESTKSFTNKLLNTTDTGALSQALSNLLVLKNKTAGLERSPEWGYFQFQKFRGLVELTDLYTAEAGSLVSRISALYFLLEADKNPVYQELNKQLITKIDAVSTEASSLLNEAYYNTALLNYGKKLLFTTDILFAKETIKSVDEQITKAKATLAEYKGTNSELSENMLVLLKNKVQDMESVRNQLSEAIESIPPQELLTEEKNEQSRQELHRSLIPVAYAQMDIPGYFQQKISSAVKFVKTAKDISVAAVRVTGQQIKDLYDKSGAHEVVKDGAQIINGGVELVNSTVEVSIHGVQGIYYGDMSWKDFKQKIENEKNELHDKFVKGTLGKEQYDEMIKQVDQFQHNTGRVVENMSEFSGFVTTVVTKQSEAGKFVQDVTKNVGNEAKKVLDTATDFTKNIAIVMHPETSKEETRKALLDIYTALKETREKDEETGKMKDVEVELPDLIKITKEETLKKLGLSEEEEKEFIDELTEKFQEELKGEETKDDSKKTEPKKDEAKKDEATKDTTKSTTATPPTSSEAKSVNQIFTNPNLTDEQIREILIKEITKGLSPLPEKGSKPESKETEQKDLDQDADGISDSRDNCPELANPDQADMDKDGIGNDCDPDCSGDVDGDGVCNELDNCPQQSNPDQADFDKDSMGDICDDDAPPLSEIAGTWPGSMTVTDVVISDALRAEAAKGEGCDISELEKAKGQVKPVSITLMPNGENGGTLSMSGADVSEKRIPFTYNNGVLSASYEEEGSSINFNMNFSQQGSVGSVDMNYLGGMAIITGSLDLKK